jgi:hypothetical protein
MGSRADLIARIAPVAPPCFESRSQWVTYLSSAAEGQKPTTLFEHKDSLVLVRDERGDFQVNPCFAYCRDCQAKHAHAMLTAGRCKPNHLIEQAAQAATEASNA